MRQKADTEKRKWGAASGNCLADGGSGLNSES